MFIHIYTYVYICLCVCEGKEMQTLARVLL